MSTETEQAPERITIRPRSGGTDYFPVHAPPTEYVRADLHAALAAENEQLRERIEELELGYRGFP